MTTIEAIQEWKENPDKEFIRTDFTSSNHRLTNNGLGVLFISYFVTTLQDPRQESKPFTISTDNLEWVWEEIEYKYNVLEALKLVADGRVLKSLATGKELKADTKDTETLTILEIDSMWIEVFKEPEPIAVEVDRKYLKDWAK